MSGHVSQLRFFVLTFTPFIAISKHFGNTKAVCQLVMRRKMIKTYNKGDKLLISGPYLKQARYFTFFLLHPFWWFIEIYK
jgi:hypothetical protein